MIVTGSDLSKKTFGNSGESTSDEVGGDMAREDGPAAGIRLCGGVIPRSGLDKKDGLAIWVVKAGSRLRFTEEVGVAGVDAVSGLILTRGVGERESRSEKRVGNGSVLRM
jgi:hypothetical protein